MTIFKNYISFRILSTSATTSASVHHPPPLHSVLLSSSAPPPPSRATSQGTLKLLRAQIRAFICKLGIACRKINKCIMYAHIININVRPVSNVKCIILLSEPLFFFFFYFCLFRQRQTISEESSIYLYSIM